MSMLDVALADAAHNCARDGAVAALTLRSGVQFVGNLQKSASRMTAHLLTERGWVTVMVEEIAAVGIEPK